jgi:hypothetical protein
VPSVQGSDIMRAVPNGIIDFCAPKLLPQLCPSGPARYENVWVYGNRTDQYTALYLHIAWCTAGPGTDVNHSHGMVWHPCAPL